MLRRSAAALLITTAIVTGSAGLAGAAEPMPETKISGTDLGSGRVAELSGTDLGSSRVVAPSTSKVSGLDLGSSR